MDPTFSFYEGSFNITLAGTYELTVTASGTEINDAGTLSVDIVPGLAVVPLSLVYHYRKALLFV